MRAFSVLSQVEHEQQANLVSNEQETGSNDDDRESERKLTRDPNAGIYVSTNFSVSRS